MIDVIVFFSHYFHLPFERPSSCSRNLIVRFVRQGQSTVRVPVHVQYMN